MKILKETGHYLDEQAKINKKIAYIFYVIGGVGLLYSFISINFLLILISTFIIGIGGFFSYINIDYVKGLYGEILVTEYLRRLDDSYYLINDVKLPNSYGNIDHILLGPNGIFVIETKNFEGDIRCDGDNWYQYKQEWKNPEEYERKSPSKQVKGNSLRLKQFIESKNIFKKPFKLWVDGIVVFTNENVELILNRPTVPVIKIRELYKYIKNKKSNLTFSPQELESIGKEILRRAEAD